MKPEEIINHIENAFEGAKPKSSWGETSLFYNPNNLLPNGVYFCTIKEKDGENDKASKLDRKGIFRVSIGLSKITYESKFGSRPTRPAKGCIICTNDNFTQTTKLMPHPIYGWMSWVKILNPDKNKFEKLLPLLKEVHSNAVIKFNKKTANKPTRPL